MHRTPSTSVPFPTRVRLAFGDLCAQPWRTLLSVLVLAPLAASWFLLAAVSSALADLGDAGEARNLVVTEPDVFDTANIALGPSHLSVAAQAAGDDAESVTALVLRLVELDDRVLQVRAADPATWSSVHGLELLEGTTPDATADEIAITAAVQTATGWGIGDRVRVYGTEFTVSALLRGSGSKVASLWLPIDRAERLFERPDEFQFAVVRVRANSDGDQVADRLRAAFPDLLVLDESAIQAEATRGVRSLGDLTTAFIAVGMVGLAVGSANATALALAERRRSVGMLRVMGFTPATVRSLLAMRAFLLTFAALVVGFAAARLFLATRPTFVLRTFTVDPQLQLLPVLVGVSVSLVSGWLGAVVAARRVLRTPPSQLVVT